MEKPGRGNKTRCLMWSARVWVGNNAGWWVGDKIVADDSSGLERNVAFQRVTTGCTRVLVRLLFTVSNTTYYTDVYVWCSRFRRVFL